jgi:hypothetical protein
MGHIWACYVPSCILDAVLPGNMRVLALCKARLFGSGKAIAMIAYAFIFTVNQKKYFALDTNFPSTFISRIG